MLLLLYFSKNVVMEEKGSLDEEQENVYEINSDFPFSKMSLENPEPISNGFYFIPLSINNKPLYVQMPKCTIKNGIISNKKEKYCDLLYFYKENKELIEWIEQMEISCKDMIDNKKKLWFQSDLTREDIDNMMTPLYRLYKSGVNVLIRAYIDVNKHNGKPKCLIYDENENNVEMSSVDTNQTIIPLFHIEGIRFSSKTFELDIKLTQMMIFDDEEKPSCMIKRDANSLGEKNKMNVSFVQDNEKTNTNTQLSRETKTNANADTDADANANTNTQCSSEKVNAQVSETTTNEIVSREDEEENLTQEEIVEVSLDGLDTSNKSEVLELKKPNQVYYKLYKAARKKAIKMREKAVEAFLEAKQIKTKYMLQDLYDSSDDSLDDSDEL